MPPHLFMSKGSNLVQVGVFACSVRIIFVSQVQSQGVPGQAPDKLECVLEQAADEDCWLDSFLADNTPEWYFEVTRLLSINWLKDIAVRNLSQGICLWSHIGRIGP